MTGPSHCRCAAKVLIFLNGLAGAQQVRPFAALQDAICQCKQLRTLHIAVEADKEIDRRDASRLLMKFPAELPNLTVLLWQEEAPSVAEKSVRHLSAGFRARLAAETPAGSGLRLLHAEECSFEAVPPLSTSLQVLSFRHGMETSGPSHTNVAALVAPSAALRELYILGVKLRASNVLSLPLVAAACPLLQVLVVHVCLETGQQVSLSLHSSMQRLSTATAALMLVCGSPGICLQSCVRRTYRWARERVLLPRLRSWCSTPMQRMFLS